MYLSKTVQFEKSSAMKEKYERELSTERTQPSLSEIKLVVFSDDGNL